MHFLFNVVSHVLPRLFVTFICNYRYSVSVATTRCRPRGCITWRLFECRMSFTQGTGDIEYQGAPSEDRMCTAAKMVEGKKDERALKNLQFLIRPVHCTRTVMRTELRDCVLQPKSLPFNSSSSRTTLTKSSTTSRVNSCSPTCCTCRLTAARRAESPLSGSAATRLATRRPTPLSLVRVRLIDARYVSIFLNNFDRCSSLYVMLKIYCVQVWTCWCAALSLLMRAGIRCAEWRRHQMVCRSSTQSSSPSKSVSHSRINLLNFQQNV